ncbi:MAG: YgjV family protein [Acholeplasmataceae bacterium]
MFSVKSLLDIKEWVGILAGLFIVISFLMKGEMKIRAVNIIGAALFVIYGFLIGSISVTVLNVILIIVQVSKIYNYRRGKSR